MTIEVRGYRTYELKKLDWPERRAVMTIDQIREIVISPDAIMKKEWGKVLLDEIDRLTARAEKAEAFLKDALPNIECSNTDQSALITAIGNYLNRED